LKPLFSASERRYPIYFHYPWSESDSVTIEIPNGFELDNAEKPSPIKAVGVAEYDVRIGIDVEHRELLYNRSFTFGLGGHILFPLAGSGGNVQQIYSQVKIFFDVVQERDGHTLTLKQTTPPK
jgi:hypothetical protein